MSDVTTAHADYIASAPKWKSVEDAAAGEAAVKGAGEAYLPKPNPGDLSEENRRRYKQYVLRAVYYNATGRTLAGLTGMAFGDQPEVALPTDIEFAIDDISGAGLELDQQAQASLSEVLKTGRAGLLADYPAVNSEVSKAEQAAGDIRPTITLYCAGDIDNWRTSRVGGKTVLSFVKLKETYEEIDASGFGASAKPQYRVLLLVGGIYIVEIWRQVPTLGGTLEWQRFSASTPTRGDGGMWTEIPFTFIGSKNNDSAIDSAPLYDIACLNLAHYRNSADYEEAVYQLGQPTVFIAGLTEDWRDHLQKNGAYIGSRSLLPLPVGGTAGILQAQANTMAKEAMDAKEKQMAALGARLIHEATSAKTATQQRSEDTVAHSVLAICCANVSAAYEKALGWFAVFANTTGDITYVIPTDFSASDLDAQTLLALLQAVQSGNMPQADLWAQMRRAGLIGADKDDDDVREEIESQPPMMGSLNLDPSADPTQSGGNAAI